MMIQIEWDEQTNQINRRKHQLEPQDAHEVLLNSCLVCEDSRCDYGEKRYIALGTLRKRMVVLVFTIREDICRIISMRKTHDKEQKAYQNQLEKVGQAS